MRDFLKSEACHSHKHCVACRTDPAWRAKMAVSFTMPNAGLDFRCPQGVTAKTAGVRLIVPDSAAACCAACVIDDCPNIIMGGCGGECRKVRIVTDCPQGVFKIAEVQEEV